MREILFRGKKVDTGEWAEGDFARSHGRTYCGYYFETISQVDPSTVGQYTGLTDKNGKKIFEGDIVFVPRLGKSYEVKFMLGQFFVGINYPIAYERHTCEVIGNIHDNPELLKE